MVICQYKYKYKYKGKTGSWNTYVGGQFDCMLRLRQYKNGDLPIPSVPPQTEGRECRLKKQTMANIGSSEEGDNGNYPLLELAHTDWDNWG